MKSLFLLATLVVIASSSFSQQATPSLNLSKSGLAIDGYDPVSYFNAGSAKEGRKEFSYELHGATYRFANAQNRQLFIANPAKYQPQYGGWCAYAMGSSGEKVSIDPETFKVLDGKLYLFYNSFFNNTLKSWNKDETNLKRKADANWMKLVH